MAPTLDPQEIEPLIEKIKSSMDGPQSLLSLDGGHIYTDQAIDSSHLDGLAYTAQIQKHLTKQGIPTQTHLLIDDYNVDPNKACFDSDQYLALAEKLGLQFDHVTYESSLVPLATQILQTLQQTQRVIQGAGPTLKAKTNGKPMLIKPNGDHSCSLLDATFTQQKGLHGANACLNVLPSEYKPQQKNLQRILDLLPAGLVPPTFTYFFQPTKNV